MSGTGRPLPPQDPAVTITRDLQHLTGEQQIDLWLQRLDTIITVNYEWDVGEDRHGEVQTPRVIDATTADGDNHELTDEDLIYIDEALWDRKTNGGFDGLP